MLRQKYNLGLLEANSIHSQRRRRKNEAEGTQKTTTKIV